MARKSKKKEQGRGERSKAKVSKVRQKTKWHS